MMVLSELLLIHKDSLSALNLAFCKTSHIFFLCVCVCLQYFYLWKKDKNTLKDMKEKEKELLLEVRRHEDTGCSEGGIITLNVIATDNCLNSYAKKINF